MEHDQAEWLVPEAEHSHPAVERLETLLNLEWEVTAGQPFIFGADNEKIREPTDLPRWRIRLKSPEKSARDLKYLSKDPRHEV